MKTPTVFGRFPTNKLSPSTVQTRYVRILSLGLPKSVTGSLRSWSTLRPLKAVGAKTRIKYLKIGCDKQPELLGHIRQLA